MLLLILVLFAVIVKSKPPLMVEPKVKFPVPVLIELFPVNVMALLSESAALFVLIETDCNNKGLVPARLNVPKSVPMFNVPPRTVLPVPLFNINVFVEPPETPFKREIALLVVDSVVLAAPSIRFPLYVCAPLVLMLETPDPSDTGPEKLRLDSPLMLLVNAVVPLLPRRVRLPAPLTVPPKLIALLPAFKVVFAATVVALE